MTARITFLVSALLVSGLFAQAPRPPINRLQDLTDVNLSSITDGQVLTFNGASSKWKNAAGGGGGAVKADNYALYAALGGGVVAEPTGIYMVNLTAAHTLTTQLLELIGVYLDVGKTLTGVKFEQVATGSYTASNNNKVGLYTYSGGTLTLVASSTNNGAIWQGSPNTFQSVPFSSAYVAAPGLYFVGLLYNESAQTTAPTIGAITSLGNNAPSSADFTNSAKINGQLTLQNDLPASQAMSGVAASTFRQWVGLY